MNIEIYSGSDYAGFKGNKIRGYYGYEETMPVRNESEDSEWCAVIWKNGKEVLRIPNSRLLPQAPEESPIGMLLAAVAIYLNK